MSHVFKDSVGETTHRTDGGFHPTTATTATLVSPKYVVALLTSGFGVRVPGGVLGDIDAHQQVLSVKRILLVGVVDL